MPINKDLPLKNYPFTIKWDEKATTKFINALDGIRVDLVDCPTREQLKSYIPSYSQATWEDKPRNDYTEKEREDCIRDLFQFKVLPTAHETVNFTFLISNIDLIDVTHLIRHRTMSFSAHCTGDRDLRHDDVLIKPSIEESPYAEDYKSLVRQCKDLYAMMVDDMGISICDARTILPRSSVNHYYARVNLRDFVGFLKQRLDRQIQPESDNIIALKMLIEVAKVFPEIKYSIDLYAPDQWFIKTAPLDKSTNLYQPEPRNNIFDWHPQWFIYPRQREEMTGGQQFMELWEPLVQTYEDLTDDD